MARWVWFGAGVGTASAIFLGYLLLAAPSPPMRMSVPARPTPVPAVVYVTGEVAAPGVYHVPADARLDDVLRLAGGASVDADLAGINLAARVVDGQRLHVPERGKARAESASVGSSATDIGSHLTESVATPVRRVNLNTASLADLDALPGVGPVTAQKIVTQRQKAAFTSVDQLLELKIVTSATLARLRDLVVAE